jgi:hypothetical protein
MAWIFCLFLKKMKDKIYDPARLNEQSPAKGFAAVNTHNEEETPIEELTKDQEKEGVTEEEARETNAVRTRNSKEE